jgi:hypothetical protein
MKLSILSLTALLLPIACTFNQTGPYEVKKRESQFGVGSLAPSWHKKYFRGADLFFEHESKKAAIFLSSECDRVSDSPLEALTSQLLVGMGKYEIISQQRIEIMDREAVVTEVNVDLDGVNRYLKIMVMRKNRCVFDAVFNAAQKNELVDDFDQLLKSFWAEAKL